MRIFTDAGGLPRRPSAARAGLPAAARAGSAVAPVAALALSATAAAVAVALALAVLAPCDALALEARSGSFGVRVEVPATADADNEAGGTIGIRLDVPDAADEAHESAGDVGIRLEVPATADENDQASGDVGIRLEVPTEADDAHEASGDVGIRLDIPTTSDENNEASGGIGIRMQVEGVYYTVAYHAGEGAWADGSHDRSTAVEADTEAALPEAPRYAGHGFGGWVDEAGAAWEADRIVTRDTDLYAVWYEKPVNVRYDANGGAFAGDDGSPETVVESYVDGAFVYPDPDPERTGCKFAGWWTDNGLGDDGAPDGAWGQSADDILVPDVPEGGDGQQPVTTLYARWVASTIDIVVDDENGAFASSGWKGSVVYGEPLAVSPADGAPSMDEVPKLAGYTLSGLWWQGEGADGEPAEVPYYTVEYDYGYGSWVRGPAFTDNRGRPAAWGALDHLEDLLSAGGAGAQGPDGVPDTLVLHARWNLTLHATVPVSLTFALKAEADERPVAIGPEPDAFAIRSYATVPMTVSAVSAEGLDGPAGADAGDSTDAGPSGLSALLRSSRQSGDGTGWLGYTDALGPSEGEDIALTLAPGSDDANAVRLSIADGGGACRDDASPDAEHFTIAASPDGLRPAALAIKWGLEMPEGIRARSSDGPEEIARVEFTLSATLPSVGE